MLIHRLRSWAPFIGAALAGALAMDYPQTLWPLIFVFLTPIISHAQGLRGVSLGKRAVLGLFARMFAFGLTFSILSTPWIGSTYPLTWLNIPDPILSIGIIAGIWLSFGITLALPITPWIYVVYRASAHRPSVQMLIGGASWILMEYARSWMVALSEYGEGVLFGPHHTYYSLSYVLSGVPVIRDLFAVGGLYLATFVVVIVNFLILYALAFVRSNTVHRRDVVCVALATVLVIFGSSLGMSRLRASDTAGERFTISVLNTHLPSSTNDDVEAEKTRIGLALISGIDTKNGILILPENLDVFNSYLSAKDSAKSPLSRFHLVIGSHPDKNAHSMYFFEPDTKQGVRYQKQLLMPIGEYSVDWVEFLVRMSHKASWIDAYDLRVVQHGTHKGAGITLYRDRVFPGLVLAGTICAENISPYIFRDQTRAGATVLTNISALSPFRNNPSLRRQTLAIDTTRAIENGRYLVVAGNDNKSFVVADTGDIVAFSGDDVPNSAFNAEVQVHTYKTPYANYGDYMVALAFAFLLIVGLWFVV